MLPNEIISECRRQQNAQGNEAALVSFTLTDRRASRNGKAPLFTGGPVGDVLNEEFKNGSFTIQAVFKANEVIEAMERELNKRQGGGG